MEGIRLGTFDFLLTKPADSQLLASAQVMAPQAVTDVVVGVGVICYGVSQPGVTLSLADLGLFLITLLAGLVIVYSFLLMLSTCAFWFVKLDNILVIFQALFGNAGRWPVTIFPGWLRALLTFAVPVAFAVTVPAQALTGQLDLGTALLADRRRGGVLRRRPGVLAVRPPPLHRRLGLSPAVPPPASSCSSSAQLLW